MLERKIEYKLLEWKKSRNKLCAIVRGARQIGKTFSIECFGKKYYKYYIYINFIEKPEYSSIFENNIDAETIINQLKYRFGPEKIVKGKTLIFLDEIQNCPNAITALKFLSLDGKYDIIASGSMLGMAYKEVSSFPVGYVENIEMHSLDFEEFLWAKGLKESIPWLKSFYEKREHVPDAVHNDMMNNFKEYIAVGGMPKVVQSYIDHKDFNEVLKLQKNIVSNYSDDIAKYAEGNDKAKARACFYSIPKQLAKYYKKFQYSLVENNGSARKFFGSLMWLYDAGMVNFCYNLSLPELPLEGNARNDAFKVYMKDTGLLVAMLEEGSQSDILSGNLGIYKGAVYENIIADIFAKSGKQLFYFEYNSQLEIDFFIRYNNKATAVEVKSSENTKSKSLASVLNNRGVEQGIRLSSKNIGENGKILSLPLYMAMFL